MGRIILGKSLKPPQGRIEMPFTPLGVGPKGKRQQAIPPIGLSVVWPRGVLRLVIGDVLWLVVLEALWAPDRGAPQTKTDG